MRFTGLELTNWRNFRKVDVTLAERVFLVGPNASGKTNLLDVFRFLRDLVADGGGLTKAVERRGGMSRLRSLHARGQSKVRVKVTMRDEASNEGWTYELAFDHAGPKGGIIVLDEVVTRTDAAGRVETVLRRPDAEDRGDRLRLTQAAIQQVNVNREFRAVRDFFASIRYSNLVPHLVRESSSGSELSESEGVGRDILIRMKQTPCRTRDARLKRIAKVLQRVVPQFESLVLEDDEVGRPHLVANFAHWRKHTARQDEAQFSDGTLRLIAILWELQEKSAGPLLLEEPEWSLHSTILRQFAGFVGRMQRISGGRQVLMTTHSEALLEDEGIGSEEILLIAVRNEGSEVMSGPAHRQIHEQMSRGVPASLAAIPVTGEALQGLLFAEAQV